MRKVDDGEKKRKKRKKEKKKKRMAFLVATTSLPTAGTPHAKNSETGRLPTFDQY